MFKNTFLELPKDSQDKLAKSAGTTVYYIKYRLLSESPSSGRNPSFPLIKRLAKACAELGIKVSPQELAAEFAALNGVDHIGQ